MTPALSSDPAARDAFFVSLKDVSNRRHEAWVLDGISYLHHPLRAAQSVATHAIAAAAQAQGMKGPKVGEMIHHARVEAVAKAL